MASQSFEFGGVHEPSPELDQLLQYDLVVGGREHELLDVAHNGLRTGGHGFIIRRRRPLSLHDANQPLLNVSSPRDRRAWSHEQQHRHTSTQGEAALVWFLKSILYPVVVNLTGLAIIKLRWISSMSVRECH
jgi:hypothetical protein